MLGDTRYFYRRYMDDVIILAKTRCHLNNAVRTVNQHFNHLKVVQAPDKPFRPCYLTVAIASLRIVTIGTEGVR